MRTVTPWLALFAVTTALALGPARGARAQTWSETGDAGSLVSTAQVPTGAGPLTTIAGALASPEDVDIYCIRTSEMPRVLGLPVVQLACAAQMGPCLWLFDANGLGVATNVTCVGGYKTLTTTTVGPNGTYYLAVSYYGMDPFSSLGSMWLPALPGERTPDGPGAVGPLTNWAGTPVVQGPDPYSLTLSYTGYCEAPVETARGTWGTLKMLYRD